MINVCDKHFTENDGNLVRDYFIKIAMKNPIIELIQDPSLLPFEMKQTNFTPGKGNALQICISVLFDIRNYDKIVPNFIEDPKGYAFGITQFLNTINYEMKKINLNKNTFDKDEIASICQLPLLCMLRGKSPRGDHGHVIVAEIQSDLTFKPVFDPHPDNRMLDVNEHYGWMMVFYKTRN